MEFNLDHTIALLSRTPACLTALLRDLPDDWTMQNEGGESWSPFDIVGHLIHGELTDWMPRARIILDYGNSRPFEKFDRLAQNRASKGRSLAELLGEFAELRAKNLSELRRWNLQEADFTRPGLHPELGAVTLSELLATWAVHDVTHIHQIARVMAHQYRKAVGPWSAYLGVLHCEGHSA